MEASGDFLDAIDADWMTSRSDLHGRLIRSSEEGYVTESARKKVIRCVKRCSFLWIEEQTLHTDPNGT
jgi:hypothetical protein